MSKQINELTATLMSEGVREDRAELLATRYVRYSNKAKKSELWQSNVTLVCQEIAEACNEDTVESLSTYRGIKPSDVAEL